MFARVHVFCGCPVQCWVPHKHDQHQPNLLGLWPLRRSEPLAIIIFLRARAVLRRPLEQSSRVPRSEPAFETKSLGYIVESFGARVRPEYVGVVASVVATDRASVSTRSPTTTRRLEQQQKQPNGITSGADDGRCRLSGFMRRR